jgi:N-acetylgalactosamine-N,N'-diacetylbacillosaminyl-diphospho-undecaprenol 4-alpha-N-acetylgalactosaminyltransferase
VRFLSSEKQGGSEAGANMLRLPIVAWRLLRYCKRNEIDLVLSFMNRPNFAAGLAKIFGLSSKAILSERVYTPHFYDSATLRGKIGRKLVSWLYRYADTLVPNSEGTKAALVDMVGTDIDYHVALNQIPVQSIRVDGEAIVDDVDFTKFTFVCVAGFRQQKNHKLLIEALSRIDDQDALLVLIGKGPTLEAVKEKVEDLGLSKRVIFLGQKENPHKYVSKAQCFVLPSDFEGFPNVLLEAMACGTPIVSTDCLTGPRELLAPTLESPIPTGTPFHGEYGVLVNVGDVDALAKAMSEMISNHELRERYGEAGARRVQDFDRDTHPDPFRHVISSVLEGRPL